MKKNLIILVLVFAIAKLYGQTYFEITFDGEGAMPETVIVENLTQGTDLEMPGNDVLHLLLEPVKVSNMEMESKELSIFPNPMKQACNIEFLNAKEGNVSISLYSITGKQIQKYSNVLSKGLHNLTLTGVAAGSYLLSVQTETDLFSGQFISVGQIKSEPSFFYNEKNAETNSLELRSTKNNKSIVEMNFTIGDELRFTGIAAGFQNVIVVTSPTEDQTITFVFDLCEGVSISASNGGAYEEGETIVLSAYNPIGESPFSYSWSGPEDFESELENPEIANSTLSMSGTYTVTMTDANDCTATASTVVVVTDPFECGTLLSYEGHNYTTVQIGDQCWFAENLRYDNGCSEVDWIDNSDEGWCGCYDNNCPLYEDNYGLLYQWSAAMDGSTTEGAQGLCPDGWHVPTHYDWTTLERYVCEDAGNIDCATKFPYNVTDWGWRGTDEGTRLKGDVSWNGTNDHNFDGKPSGKGFVDYTFAWAGERNRWWTSTNDSNTNKRWRRALNSTENRVFRGEINQNAHSMSVRCIKD